MSCEVQLNTWASGLLLSLGDDTSSYPQTAIWLRSNLGRLNLALNKDYQLQDGCITPELGINESGIYAKMFSCDYYHKKARQTVGASSYDYVENAGDAQGKVLKISRVDITKTYEGLARDCKKELQCLLNWYTTLNVDVIEPTQIVYNERYGVAHGLQLVASETAETEEDPVVEGGSSSEEFESSQSGEGSSVAPAEPEESSATANDEDAQLIIDRINTFRATESEADLSTDEEATINGAVLSLKGQANDWATTNSVDVVDVWSSIYYWTCMRPTLNVGVGSTVVSYINNYIVAPVSDHGTLFNGAPWGTEFNGSTHYFRCGWTSLSIPHTSPTEAAIFIDHSEKNITATVNYGFVGGYSNGIITQEAGAHFLVKQRNALEVSWGRANTYFGTNKITPTILRWADGNEFSARADATPLILASNYTDTTNLASNFLLAGSRYNVVLNRFTKIKPKSFMLLDNDISSSDQDKVADIINAMWP